MKLLSAWRPLSSACAQQSRRCYSVTTNGEYWLRGYLSDAMVRFRVALRTLWPRGRVAVRRGQGPPVLSRYLQRWAKQTRAADLRRRAARQLFAGARLPLMGLTGVCLITKPSLVTSEEELESVCVALRELAVTMSKQREVAQVPDKEAVNLDDLELGTVLGKGANAIVYSGRWRTPVSTRKHRVATDDSHTASAALARAAAKDLGGEETQKEVSSVEDSAVPVKHLQEFSPAAALKEDGPRFDLAVKVLFNYYAASNATAIWDSLQKECLPVLVNQLLPTGLWRCRLPPHAHIVEMPVAFVDSVSLLPGATVLWPSALSPRLHPRGCGRNATLYLVMRRYQCSLAEYLQSGVAASKDPRVRLSLLCQLLEAVCHLGQHGVAHRDLKADNLLLDLSKGAASPRLVLSDFGSCLANLHLHFVSPEVNRGGNPALMPPEVAGAEPGLLSIIDYRRADLWAAGTLAYELYGAPNPFYDLDSRSYAESDLPQPPGAMPPVVQALVRDMLRRDPKQRPSPPVAATICQMLLLAPKDLLGASSDCADARRILRWLCSLAANTLPHWEESMSREISNAGGVSAFTMDQTEKLHVHCSDKIHSDAHQANISDSILTGKSLMQVRQSGPVATLKSAKPKFHSMSLDLAKVLLSRVSLPQALEALRYIRVHGACD
uniref:non-specific serine/threonine protein kinase n=1 Tax=Rhipicephalus appendiculatus TaxID=34631 RepID=A0A131YUD8_RHIAP